MAKTPSYMRGLVTESERAEMLDEEINRLKGEISSTEEEKKKVREKLLEAGKKEASLSEAWSRQLRNRGVPTIKSEEELEALEEQGIRPSEYILEDQATRTAEEKEFLESPTSKRPIMTPEGGVRVRRAEAMKYIANVRGDKSKAKVFDSKKNAQKYLDDLGIAGDVIGTNEEGAKRFMGSFEQEEKQKEEQAKRFAERQKAAQDRLEAVKSGKMTRADATIERRVRELEEKAQDASKAGDSDAAARFRQQAANLGENYTRIVNQRLEREAEQLKEFNERQLMEGRETVTSFDDISKKRSERFREITRAGDAAKVAQNEYSKDVSRLRRAIRQARLEGDVAKESFWQSQLDNITQGVPPPGADRLDYFRDRILKQLEESRREAAEERRRRANPI